MSAVRTKPAPPVESPSTRARSLGSLEDSLPWLLAGAGGLIAGAIHLALAPEHFSEAAGLGLFFLGLGTAQIVWALWHLARPSYGAWLAGIAISFCAILVYVGALLTAAPFSQGPEPADYAGIFTKAVEGATLLLLAIPLVLRSHVVGQSRGRVAVAVLIALGLGIVAAGSAWGAGLGAEGVAPSLAKPSGHTHGGEEVGHAHDSPVTTTTGHTGHPSPAATKRG